MSAKKRKSETHLFSTCDKCDTILLNKDFNPHIDNNCQLTTDNPSQLKYSHIKNKILYTTLTTKASNENESVSHEAVHMSSAAMNLCGFTLGEKVFVRSLETGIAFEKTILPVVDGAGFSVHFTRTAIMKTFFIDGVAVAISKSSRVSKVAKKIAVICINPPVHLEVDKFLINKIRNCYKKCTLKVGSKIKLFYYAIVIKFEVVVIEPKECEERDLDERLNELCIDDELSEFFEIMEDALWTIYRNKEEYERKINYESDLKMYGIDKEISFLQEIMNDAVGNTKPTASNLNLIRTVLLHGPSGIGKMSLVRLLTKRSGVNVRKLSLVDFLENISQNQNYTLIENYFEPTIYVINGIENFCPIVSSTSNIWQLKSQEVFEDSFLKLRHLPECKIFVIATSRNPNLINPSIRINKLIHLEIKIPMPNKEVRLNAFKQMLNETNLTDLECEEIINKTHGYTFQDLENLCSKARMFQTKNHLPSVENFLTATKLVVPTVMQGLQVEVDSIKWTDIGGQQNLKSLLREAVEWPLKFPERYVHFGIRPSRGILMYGPPGCSKTMIAKAVATETGLNFMSVKGPELFNKYVGESERNVRELFNNARLAAPTVIFFDEIDSLGSEKGSNANSNVQDNVLTQLLTEMDGVQSLGEVIILGATNRPDKIDKALLRPGRFDKVIYVPLPDDQTREEIFRLHFRKMPVKDIPVQKWVLSTNKYSGAEIGELCREAAICAIRRGADHIEELDFQAAAKTVTPKTPDYLINIYETFNSSNF